MDHDNAGALLTTDAAAAAARDSSQKKDFALQSTNYYYLLFVDFFGANPYEFGVPEIGGYNKSALAFPFLWLLALNPSIVSGYLSRTS